VRWVVTWTDDHGRTRKKTVTGSFEEAKNLKRSIEDAKQRGDPILAASKLTLDEYLDGWLRTYQGRGRKAIRAHTKAEYAKDIALARAHFGPKLRLAALTRQNVADYARWLSEQPNGKIGRRGQQVSITTVKRRLVPLRAALSDAVEGGLIAANPAERVRILGPERIEEDEDRIRALSREQVGTLLVAVDPQHRPLIRFAVETGCRVSEIVGLQWRHVSLGKRPVVNIPRAIVKGKAGPPKSRHGRRTIPLSPGMARELRLLRAQAEAAHRSVSFEDTLVFATRNGTPLDPGNVRRRVLQPACVRAGLPKLGMHDLRHTCASLLLHEGRSVVQVQKVLRHHSPAFTLSRYAHLLDGDLGAALDIEPTGPETPGPVLAAVLDN